MNFRFIILLFIAIINFVLGFLVYFKNKSRERFVKYFALMCFSAGLWSFCVALTLIIKNSDIFLWIVRGSFIFAILIFISFLLFTIEFPYRIKRINKIFKYYFYLSTFFVFYVILFKLVVGSYIYNSNLYQIENKQFHLYYGTYFLILIIYSYYLLFLKHKESQGINKKRLMLVIFGTLISFILGIFFVWFIPHINKHYLQWLGPIFSLFMTFSIGYLLFKKN